MTRFFEHDFEPVAGLPGTLPEGEYICWQGSPDWRDLAVSALHVRKLAIYFAAMLAWRAWVQLGQGANWVEILQSSVGLTLLAGVAVGLLCLLAWLMARTSRYTITNRRLVIRSGVALPITVNLPFSHVISAEFRKRRDGFGDLPLTLQAGSQASWVVLWPHVRPWSVGRVQPMLRSLADAAHVAELLGDALRGHAREAKAPQQAPRVSRDGPAHGAPGHTAGQVA